jgi:hypothetical protein
MKTILDEFRTAFLRTAVYAGGELKLIIAEGICANEPEDLSIGGHVIKETYALYSTAQSRLVEVHFKQPVVWQLVDESFTAWDEYEIRDDKFMIQKLTRSRYLDYVRANHGWFEDILRGKGKHYRIWTEDEVVDVVSCEPPTVNLTRGM